MASPHQPARGKARIAVDVMGGDFAPANEVAGVVEALRMFGDRVQPILVGDRAAIEAELVRLEATGLDLEIVHTAEKVEMSEHGADSFRKKRDSSLNVATRLVRDGAAMGVISMGNTGAMVASSLINMGRIPGVSRPALAAPIPTGGEVPITLVLDVGATADCKPVNLLQFAILGEVYMRLTLNLERPRVGLLNIGEESSKGNELTQEAFNLLAGSGLNFVGNVEGKDILNGRAEVVVTDGFTGNVLLKFSESVADWGMRTIRREIGEHVLAKMGAFLLKPSLRRFKNRLDYSEYGGAPLLGVDGISIVGHGRSNPKAIRNALRVASGLIHRGINDEIRGELERVNGGKVANS